MTAPRSLVADFPAATEAAWRALVEKTVGASAVESQDAVARLRSTLDLELSVAPLYTAADATPPPALPRAPPADAARAWDVRTLVDDPDPARANADALADLNGGAASLTLALVLDAASGEGVRVSGRDDLARVLDGVLLDLAPVGLHAGARGDAAATWLADLAKGAPAAPLAFNLDPLSAFAAQGRAARPMADAIARSAAIAAELSQTYPKASLFLATGRVPHEAGGTAGQELGFALACVLAYVKALHGAGLPLEAAFTGVTLGLAAEADYFLTLAKVRAGRSLMTRLAAACGAQASPRVEVRSSRRMLTRSDAWTNLLRLAGACAGAAIGGADIIQLDPFTERLTADGQGRPSALARRQARNIQLVLMEESELGRVADAAAGSWFLDSVTDDLARTAWRQLQEIESQGGVAPALRRGAFQARVEEARQQRIEDLAAGKACLVGVTAFRGPPDAPPPEISPPSPDWAPQASQAPSLAVGEEACPAMAAVALAEPFEAAAQPEAATS